MTMQENEGMEEEEEEEKGKEEFRTHNIKKQKIIIDIKQ